MRIEAMQKTKGSLRERQDDVGCGDVARDVAAVMQRAATVWKCARFRHSCNTIPRFVKD
jgi:hypothetical protein